MKISDDALFLASAIIFGMRSAGRSDDQRLCAPDVKNIFDGLKKHFTNQSNAEK